MKVRLVGIQEHYKPAPEDKEESGAVFQRRHKYNSERNPKDRGTILVALLAFQDAWDTGVDVPLSDLPEGAKIGDEFELVFTPSGGGRR